MGYYYSLAQSAMNCLSPGLLISTALHFTGQLCQIAQNRAGNWLGNWIVALLSTGALGTPV
jgi:hypothetical protein